MRRTIQYFIGNQKISILLPAFLAGILYLATLAPGVVGFDSAELITGAYTLGIVHPTGYPLYLLIAKLFTFIPIRTIAYRVNLVSVVFGVIAVYLVTRWIYSSTKSLIAAWAGAFSLALGYGMWSMATVAEVYTLQVALNLALLVTMRQWLVSEDSRWLYLMAFIFGVSTTNHVTSALFLPSLGWIIVSKIGVKNTLKQSPFILGASILGLLFYLYLPLRYAADPPLNYVKSYYKVDLTTISGMLWMVSGKAYRFFAFGYDLPGYARELLNAVLLLSKNFTILGVILGIVGSLSMIRNRRNEGIALLLAFTLNMMFFAGYAVADKDTMFIPAFGMWALLVGIGAHAVVARIGSLHLLQPRERTMTRRAFAGGLLISYLIIAGMNVQWLDRSSNIGPDLYARRVLSTLPQEAFVIGRWSSAVILEYYQYVEGIRPDIHIFNRSRYEVAMYYDLWNEGVEHEEAVAQILAVEEGIINAFAEERDVFDAEYNPYLAQYYEYQPVGQVFRLVPRQEG
jgi:hypothetical protein